MRSVLLSDYTPPKRFVLWLGEEVEGMTPDQRDLCDSWLKSHAGKKESFNVSVATGIALYGLTYPPK